MHDFFQLLAQLDIGKASFLAFTLLVIWREREAVKTMREIRDHVISTGDLIRRNTRVMEEFVGVLKRKDIEIRKREEVPRGY